MKTGPSLFLSTLLALTFSGAATSERDENGVPEEENQDRSDGPEEAPCSFPAQVAIVTGTFLALETDSSTSIFTEELVTVDWHPGGDFTVNGVVHYPARTEERVPDPEAVRKAYEGVPFVEELVEAGMSFTDAALAYSDAYDLLVRQAASEYFHGVESGLNPLDAAWRAQSVLASSQLVRSVQEPAYGGYGVVIDVEYYGLDGSTPLVLPIGEAPRIRTQLEITGACEMLEAIARFLSTSGKTKRVLILGAGSRGIKTGGNAEVYLNEVRQRLDR